MHASAQAPFSTLWKFSHDVLAKGAASKPAEKVLNVKLLHAPASCVVVPERTEKPNAGTPARLEHTLANYCAAAAHAKLRWDARIGTSTVLNPAEVLAPCTGQGCSLQACREGAECQVAICSSLLRRGARTDREANAGTGARLEHALANNCAAAADAKLRWDACVGTSTVLDPAEVLARCTGQRCSLQACREGAERQVAAWSSLLRRGARTDREANAGTPARLEHALANNCAAAADAKLRWDARIGTSTSLNPAKVL